MIAGEKTAVDSKQKIRTRYKGVDPSELEVIPAIATDEIALEERKLKVAAYVRVSTENDEQTSSYFDLRKAYEIHEGRMKEAKQQ